MGLDNLVNDKSPDDQKSSSSTGSPSGTSTSRKKLPEVTFIKNDKTGELEAKRYPDAIWENQSFLSETVELIIPSKSTLKTYKDIVNKKTGEDLYEILRDDPKRALSLCKTVKGTVKAEKPSAQQTCPVCDTKVDMFNEKYERIGNKVLHSEHTVEDLSDSGLIGDIEREWDFVESQYKTNY